MDPGEPQLRVRLEDQKTKFCATIERFRGKI